MTLLRMLMIAAAAMLVSAGAARAEATGPDFYRVTGVKSGDVLNMRSGPKHTFQIVGKIPHDGRRIKNLGECVGGLTYSQWQKATPAERKRAPQRWCRVEYGGAWGWVNARYLAED
jgi:uncharacterized protein YraI